jgi:hypothetical protein
MEGMEFKTKVEAIEHLIELEEELQADLEKLESKPGVTPRPGLPLSKIHMISILLMKEYLSIVKEQLDRSQIRSKKTKIRSQIEKVAKTCGLSYTELAIWYIELLWFQWGVPEAKYLFEEVFFDDFVGHEEAEIVIPLYTLIFEGVRDMGF